MSQSKLLLSELRNGDFAHPGEIEAILLTMKSVPKDPNQKILDVGSGLGGTANYLFQNGWGQIFGIDIDQELIHYAKLHYPNVHFTHGDALKIADLLPQNNFQVIYLFSSFFSFPNQKEILNQLAKVADKNCLLVIFDYSQSSDEKIRNPFPWSKTISTLNFIQTNNIKKLLSQSGWNLKNSIDVSTHFEKWYGRLVSEFENQKDDLRLKFPESLCTIMHDGFKKLLDHIKKRRLGGVIVYAEKN